MKLKYLAIAALSWTVVVVSVLYRWRWLTFAIWTNAAMIDHAHPLLTVGIIEGAIVISIFLLALLLQWIIWRT